MVSQGMRPVSLRIAFTLAKRSVSSTAAHSAPKRMKVDSSFKPPKVASAEAGARADANPPYLQLQNAVEKVKKSKNEPGKCVVYWMRMVDMRIKDNRALAKASEAAKQSKIPLVGLFIISPQDYFAHDRGARKIDFVLRNLQHLQDDFDKLHIPLHVEIHSPRRTIPSRVHSFMASLGCTQLFANMEYEIDELRRDIKICQIAEESNNIHTEFIHDRCVVPPGVVKSKQDKDYSVFSPYFKQWIEIINKNGDYLKESPSPHSNPESVRHSEPFKNLFECSIPKELEGFTVDSEFREHLESAWPAGEEAAQKVLDRFLETKPCKGQLTLEKAFSGTKRSSESSRVHEYGQERDRIDGDSTSRISPYLALGVISSRHCVRSTSSSSEIDGSCKTGIGRWNQEVAWRDFYNNILACFPRVSMGRPFVEKYSEIKWELEVPEAYAHDKKSGEGQLGGKEAEENFQKWKDGMTGYPIVDAAMRSLKQSAWLHNRLRMTVAMFLTKDLLIDWRHGERHFGDMLIDCDLASNNGGWQWSASTGVDPAPYFRIFNPYRQSEKADPEGAFIRHFVPELASVKGKEIHKPSESTAERLDYPKPIVDHFEARDRAVRRFKEPGAV
jgi:deoxyribodipyrimidine photo-lyase